MGNPNGNAGDYWNESAFSYKFCCLTSTVIFLIGILIPVIVVFCIDIPELTIWSFQIWRLLISMWGQYPTFMSILSVLFSFMWLHSILKVYLFICRIHKDPPYIKYFKLSLLIFKFIQSSIYSLFYSLFCLKLKIRFCFLAMAGSLSSLYINLGAQLQIHKLKEDFAVYHF